MKFPKILTKLFRIGKKVAPIAEIVIDEVVPEVKKALKKKVK